MIEVGVAVIAACLPTLRPLFQDISLKNITNSLRSALRLQSSRIERFAQDPSTYPSRRPSNTSTRALTDHTGIDDIEMESKETAHEV